MNSFEAKYKEGEEEKNDYHSFAAAVNNGRMSSKEDVVGGEDEGHEQQGFQPCIGTVIQNGTIPYTNDEDDLHQQQSRGDTSLCTQEFTTITTQTQKMITPSYIRGDERENTIIDTCTTISKKNIRSEETKSADDDENKDEAVMKMDGNRISMEAAEETRGTMVIMTEEEQEQEQKLEETNSTGSMNMEDNYRSNSPFSQVQEQVHGQVQEKIREQVQEQVQEFEPERSSNISNIYGQEISSSSFPREMLIINRIFQNMDSKVEQQSTRNSTAAVRSPIDNIDTNHAASDDGNSDGTNTNDDKSARKPTSTENTDVAIKDDNGQMQSTERILMAEDMLSNGAGTFTNEHTALEKDDKSTNGDSRKKEEEGEKVTKGETSKEKAESVQCKARRSSRAKKQVIIYGGVEETPNNGWSVDKKKTPLETSTNTNGTVDDGEDIELDPKSKRKRALVDNDRPKQKIAKHDSLEDLVWKELLDELTAFKEINGHCYVPPENQYLSESMLDIIHQHIKNTLEQSKIEELNKLGFDFNCDKTQYTWMARFHELKDYQNEHGHQSVSGKTVLGRWISRQRCNKSLAQHRVAALRSIGCNLSDKVGSFTLDDDDESHKSKEETITMRHRRKVTLREDIADESSMLGKISNLRNEDKSTEKPVATKRRTKANRKKTIEHENDTGEISYAERKKRQWNEKLDELIQYKKNNGSLNVPKKINEKLHVWINNQRAYYRTSRLHEERISQLKAIGFVFNLHKKNRDDSTSGHKSKRSNVTSSQNTDNLAQESKGPDIIPSQNRDDSVRKSKRPRKEICYNENDISINNGMELSKKTDEKSTSFDEDENECPTHWENMLEALIEFKKQNGHCNATEELTKIELCDWVERQRRDYKRRGSRMRSSLDEKRLDKLNELGFQWTTQEEKNVPNHESESTPVTPKDSKVDNIGISQEKKRSSQRKKKKILYEEFESDFDQNSAVSIAEESSPNLVIEPLPQTDYIPAFPSTGSCSWSFDPKSRVLLAKFGDDAIVAEEDKLYLLQMMERTDITVISENLAHGLNRDLWKPAYLQNFAGNDYHHKIRRFERIDPSNDAQSDTGGDMSSFREVDGFISMRITDYVDYLRRISELSNGADPTFSFQPLNGVNIDINVKNTKLYLVDFDMVKYLPRCYDDFLDTFKLASILPGGDYCMMNAVNKTGRPFMGPNLYITPPPAFTHFHQDGFGTVDSGHLCLSGYNEVVMLRRIPEHHKENALKIFNCYQKSDGVLEFDALYGLPHADGEKPPWPKHDMIEECRKMNYYPSVFILKPGQWVHINKGRLHAFRKMSTSQLPENDCHSKIRSDLIAKENLSADVTCVSVAWDWMYRGITCKGIKEELESTLACAKLARIHGRQSLAIPETATFRLAKSLLSEIIEDDSFLSIPGSKRVYQTTRNVIDQLKGILPSLREIVKNHSSAYKRIGRTTRRTYESPIPNSWQNPETFTLDPFGESDFFCKICFKELSNLYMHCDGCEKLLNKDFNICTDCYLAKKHLHNIQMHPQKDQRHATLNHTGDMPFRRHARCPCKKGPQCKDCSYCLGCSCQCHQDFVMNFRFMGMADERNLLSRVETAVGEQKIDANHNLDNQNALEKNDNSFIEEASNEYNERKRGSEEHFAADTHSQHQSGTSSNELISGSLEEMPYCTEIRTVQKIDGKKDPSRKYFSDNTEFQGVDIGAQPAILYKNDESAAEISIKKSKCDLESNTAPEKDENKANVPICRNNMQGIEQTDHFGHNIASYPNRNGIQVGETEKPFEKGPGQSGVGDRETAAHRNNDFDRSILMKRSVCDVANKIIGSDSEKKAQMVNCKKDSLNKNDGSLVMEIDYLR